MNINSVMDALGTRLGTINGINVYDYIPGSVSVPAAIVDFPEVVEYDETKGRGCDTATFPVGIVVGRADEQSARDELGAYFVSVKSAIDGTLGGVVDTAVVTQGQVLRLTFGGIEYLSAIFLVEVWV